MIAEKTREKGFVISLDTLFAIAILIALISYLGLGIMTEAPTASITRQANAKQMLDDAVTAMDNNGIIGQIFVDNTGNPLTNFDADLLYFEMKKILPENMDLNIQIEQFEQKNTDLASCRNPPPGTTQFNECFNKVSEATGGQQIPSNQEIYTGSQAFMKRQPYMKGNIANNCIIETASENKKNTTLQLDETATTITTKVSTTNTPGTETPELFVPTSKMYCYDSEDGVDANEVATVTISEKSGIRDPIAIMTIIDRSLTMSKFDMDSPIATASPIGQINYGYCTNTTEKWVAPGKRGSHALRFGSANTFVTTYNGFTNPTNFSIELWFKTTSDNINGGRLIGFGNSQVGTSTNTDRLIYMRDNGTLSFGIISGTTKKVITSPSMVVPQLAGDNSQQQQNIVANLSSMVGYNNQQWHHVVATLSSTVGMKLYVDGNPNPVARDTITRTAKNYAGFWKTGSDSLTGWPGVPPITNEFNGIIDEVRVYHRVLTAVEINQHYNGVFNNNANLVGYWAFNESSGNIASDSSGNNNTGALYNWLNGGGPSCVLNPDTPAQTTTNCPLSKASTAYTNKQSSGSYDFSSQGTLNKILSNDTLYFISSGTTYNGACKNNYAGDGTQGIWVTQPNGAIVNNVGYLYYEAISGNTVLSLGPSYGYNYGVNAWSDSPVGYYVYLRQNPASITASGLSASGTGTHEGTYQEGENPTDCSNYGNWQKISSYTFPYDLVKYNQIYGIGWQISNYQNYSGDCRWPRFYVTHKNSSGAVDWTSSTCAQGTPCSINWGSSLSGPFETTGDYELWAWSDSAVTFNVQTTVSNSFGLVFGNFGRTDSISGGTCSGATCTSTTTPMIPGETNCPTNPSNAVASLPSIESSATYLDTTTITDNYKFRGLKISTSLIGDSGAVCAGGAIGFENPISGSSNLKWYYPRPRKGWLDNNGYGVNCTNADSMDTCTSQSIIYDNTATGQPIPAGDYSVIGWAEYLTSYNIDWSIKRIDAALSAAITFINNAQWKSEDKMGIASYSTTAVLNQGPILLNAAGKTNLIGTLNGTDSFGPDPAKTMNPSGETNIGDAIGIASAAFNTQNKKFIVLLTDGQANKCEGGTACTPAEAVQYAILQADNARSTGITVYAIGFGGDAAAEDLRDIAKDPCTSYDATGACEEARMNGSNPKYPECFSNWPSLEINKVQQCGRYYFAADQSTLTEIYALIAEEIGTAIPNTKITIEAEPGTEICKCEKYETIGTDAYKCLKADDTPACTTNPEWTNQSITFDVDIAGEYKSQTFKERIPCTGEYCQSDTIKFPPPQTTIIKDQNNYIWGTETECDSSCMPNCPYDLATCRQTVPFGYRDCQIKFTCIGTDCGTIYGPQDTRLNFELNCVGFTAPKDLYIGFYKNNTMTTHIDTDLPPSGCTGNCGTFSITADKNLQYQPAAPNYTVSTSNTKLLGEGYIWGVISGAKDCSLHNTAQIYCLGESKVYYFKVQYAAWVK
ncbi:MAG: VWA domain-containing protein [Candidatus ainarchaeum sp.]|nr:VWA domain-containing protein [Candidatus ainarchaeum sp.]